MQDFIIEQKSSVNCDLESLVYLKSKDLKYCTTRTYEKRFLSLSLKLQLKNGNQVHALGDYAKYTSRIEDI